MVNYKYLCKTCVYHTAAKTLIFKKTGTVIKRISNKEMYIWQGHVAQYSLQDLILLCDKFGIYTAWQVRQFMDRLITIHLVQF